VFFAGPCCKEIVSKDELVKKSTRTFVALGVAGVLALAATPAQAIRTFISDIVFSDAESTTWTWDSFTSASLSGLSTNSWENGANVVTWDDTEVEVGGSDGLYSQVTCFDPADLELDVDGTGDKVILCDPVDITTADGVLSAQVEFRFFADLKTVRTRLIVANNSSHSVEGARVWMNYNAYQDDNTNVYRSTTSDAQYVSPVVSSTTVTTADDLRWVTDDRLEENYAPVVQYAVGRSGAAVLPANDIALDMVSGGQGGGGEDTNTYFKIPTLASGESVEFITLAQVYLVYPNGAFGGYNSWQTATLAANQGAWADTTIDSDALVFAGIEDTSKVLNWSPASPSPSTPQLANTGLDGSAYAGLAIAVLVVGAGVVAVRRRARA